VILLKGLLKEVIDKMLPPCTWFGLVTLTQTGMHLWTIPIEIIYYFIIPIICLACKAASSRAISKAVFVIGLTVFSYLGCNYNLTELTQDEVNRYKYKGIVTSFKLTAFIFVSGSLIGILVHNMQENSVCNTLLKWNAVQLGISLLSMNQFARAYKTSMWKVGDDYLTFIHIPGFQWAIFLFLLIIGNSKWNPFVALLEKSLNLQKCGKYSFGIYLNHLIVIFLVDKWDHINWMSMPEKTVIVLFVVYLTGWLWYFVFEKNLIILANRFCEFLVKKSNKYQILVENI
jgi:peptidoglycan/LPS O-acetylase OafA/YrhL